MADYNDDHPDVIRAKAEAEARLIEARAQLHPAVQVAYTVVGGVGNFIVNLGCLLILLLVVVAVCAPTLLNRIGG